MKKVMPLVYDAMKRAMDETGEAKIFSANITADDHYEMVARGEYVLETFGPDADKVAPPAASTPASTCTTTAPATAP